MQNRHKFYCDMQKHRINLYNNLHFRSTYDVTSHQYGGEKVRMREPTLEAKFGNFKALHCCQFGIKILVKG